MKPEWTELRDPGQSSGQLADRWLVREVQEEVSFHDDLEAGDWERAESTGSGPVGQVRDRKEQGMCDTQMQIFWLEEKAGFSINSNVIQLPSFLPTLWKKLRLSLGTWHWAKGPLTWALPLICTDPL